ncbi:YfiR family protein [candidate division KSB1 bacterium]|nr:YfiR family protein [candidate division KSB1 bacterium]
MRDQIQKWLLAGVLLGIWVPLHAQEMQIPEAIQVKIFLKALTYDRALVSRTDKSIQIGIIFNSKSKTSVTNKEKIGANLRANSTKTISGIPFRFRCIDISSVSNLNELVGTEHFDIFYVTPGNTKNLNEIIEISQQHHIRTMTGVEAYVEKGIAVGLVVNDKKPQIIINLNSAKAEGSDYNSHLLRLCKVLQ